MSTEPTRAEVERLKDELGLADAPDTLMRALAAAQGPRPPAESPPEPPTGPEKGTGEAGPETSAQAATLRDASASIHTIADHMPGRHPEFVRGVRYVATLLGHTADDMKGNS